MTRFLERGYDALDDDGRRAFEALLDCPDQDVLAWLCSGAEPRDPALRAVVRIVRDTVGAP